MSTSIRQNLKSKHNYTSEQLTGKTSQELKLIKLVTAFRDYASSHEENKDENDISERVKVFRLYAQRIISGTLLITDSHVVNGWLNILIGRHFLALNPTSEYLTVKDGIMHWHFDEKVQDMKTVLRPTANSKYYINANFIEHFLKNGRNTPTLKGAQTTLNSSSTNPTSKSELQITQKSVEHKNVNVSCSPSFTQ